MAVVGLWNGNLDDIPLDQRIYSPSSIITSYVDDARTLHLIPDGRAPRVVGKNHLGHIGRQNLRCVCPASSISRTNQFSRVRWITKTSRILLEKIHFRAKIGALRWIRKTFSMADNVFQSTVFFCSYHGNAFHIASLKTSRTHLLFLLPTSYINTILYP